MLQDAHATLRVAILPTLLLTLSVSATASSATIINVQAATNLDLTTTQDVYIYVPNGLFGDSITIEAPTIIFAPDTTIDFNDPAICSSGCPLDSFDLTQDALLQIFSPIGNLDIFSSGTVTVSKAPIPEPSSALLLIAGLTWLGVQRTQTRSHFQRA